jgi:hypothetical protein
VKSGTAAAYLIVIAVLFVGMYAKSHADSHELTKSQIAGCERGKQDRMDAARTYASLFIYYDGVTRAESVGPDVKRIARQIRDQLVASAHGMESRILLCKPLIEKGQSIPDTKLLRQLPGSE